jgi:Fic family protein
MGKDSPTPIGLSWLRQTLKLATPAAAVESYVVAGARRTEVRGTQTLNYYPLSYAIDASSVSHLRFALRHEPTDLGIFVAALKSIDPREIEEWIRREPTGAFSRRAWFLFETFVGRTLDVDDARTGNYVEILDPARHIVGDRRNSIRHRVIDNLLGGVGLCPTIRRTIKLEQQVDLHLNEGAKALIASYDTGVLARAVNYLYAKETHSSFAIEGESPNATRTERFIDALKAAASFDTSDKAELIKLQGQIVDSRYAATDWRDFQNFVGEIVGGYREEINFICPRPQDVPALMQAWSMLAERVSTGVDPVIAACLVAFSFVFIHPFEDGNGRIHRFLMHHVLAKRQYSPDGMIFPVSAAILRNRRLYDETLEKFSKPISKFIQWHWKEKQIVIENDTGDLYRYFDATTFAEYLYDRVADTVNLDLKDELGFVAVYDRALADVKEIVDMPDRRASLFVRLCMQNGGLLSRAKRELFAELEENEVAALEAAVKAAMGVQGLI